MDFMSVAVEEQRCDLLGILVPPHTSAVIVSVLNSLGVKGEWTEDGG